MTISTLAFKIASIRLDGGTQTRAGKDPGTVQDYRAAMLDGATFPPVVIFQDGPNNWLADGFHRVEAATLAGLVEIAADVRQGTARDARLFGLGANKTHGLRLPTLTSAPPWRASWTMRNGPHGRTMPLLDRWESPNPSSPRCGLRGR